MADQYLSDGFVTNFMQALKGDQQDAQNRADRMAVARDQSKQGWEELRMKQQDINDMRQYRSGQLDLGRQEEARLREDMAHRQMMAEKEYQLSVQNATSQLELRRAMAEGEKLDRKMRFYDRLAPEMRLGLGNDILSTWGLEIPEDKWRDPEAGREIDNALKGFAKTYSELAKNDPDLKNKQSLGDFMAVAESTYGVLEKYAVEKDQGAGGKPDYYSPQAMAYAAKHLRTPDELMDDGRREDTYRSKGMEVAQDNLRNLVSAFTASQRSSGFDFGGLMDVEGGVDQIAATPAFGQWMVENLEMTPDEYLASMGPVYSRMLAGIPLTAEDKQLIGRFSGEDTETGDPRPKRFYDRNGRPIVDGQEAPPGNKPQIEPLDNSMLSGADVERGMQMRSRAESINRFRQAREDTLAARRETGQSLRGSGVRSSEKREQRMADKMSRAESRYEKRQAKIAMKNAEELTAARVKKQEKLIQLMNEDASLERIKKAERELYEAQMRESAVRSEALSRMKEADDKVRDVDLSGPREANPDMLSDMLSMRTAPTKQGDGRSRWNRISDKWGLNATTQELIDELRKAQA